jgi:hypothetical protein
MVIGLYTKSNCNDSSYLGVNMAGIPVEIYDKKYGNELNDSIKWFYANSENGIWVSYNEKSLKRLLKMKALLSSCIVKCHILAFVEIDELCNNGVFHGYDCTGDYLNQSYLYDLLFETPENENIMMKLISNYFKEKLNENCLFYKIEDALEYARLLTYIIELTRDSKQRLPVEPGTNLRPIKIYEYF